MSFIKIPRGWEIPEREATPEHTYMNRRIFLKAMGFTGLTALGLLGGCESTDSKVERPKNWEFSEVDKLIYPVKQNRNFILDHPLTKESIAASYTNFYEFSSKKDAWKWVEKFETRPWEVEITGLVKKPGVYDVDDLLRTMPMEERLYRFRCVEAWAMAVPWTGFPMSELIKKVEPLSSARYVKMVTFMKPDQAKGQKKFWQPWPYTEGLTMAEAMNELTLLVTGIYGHPLPKQHGAPLRLITPWKYGFKSIKSIVLIEFTDKQPSTFWNTLASDEYGFVANVNPDIPHPRWSQATERILGTRKRRVTLLYNGYGKHVSHLYR